MKIQEINKILKFFFLKDEDEEDEEQEEESSAALHLSNSCNDSEIKDNTKCKKKIVYDEDSNSKCASETKIINETNIESVKIEAESDEEETENDDEDESDDDDETAKCMEDSDDENYEKLTKEKVIFENHIYLLMMKNDKSLFF